MANLPLRITADLPRQLVAHIGAFPMTGLHVCSRYAVCTVWIASVGEISIVEMMTFCLNMMMTFLLPVFFRVSDHDFNRACHSINVNNS